MTRLTDEEILAKLEACGKELDESPEKARQFFVNAGIYDKNGQIRKEYKAD